MMAQLRILHLAICLFAAAALAAFGALRGIGSATTQALPTLVGWTLLGLAAMTILTAASIRTGIIGMRAGDPIDAWIVANRIKCILLWAILEGGVLLCAVAFFLGADPWVAGALAAGGLGFLASQSPGALAGH